MGRSKEAQEKERKNIEEAYSIMNRNKFIQVF